MSTPASVLEPQSPDVASYIADMLAELAEMAARQGDAELETVIRIAAIRAERARRGEGTRAGG